MSEGGVLAAIISGSFLALIAVIAWVRFRRKDRADVAEVEEGTISGRFKDADSLMRFVADRVKAETAPMREELEAAHRAADVLREWVSQIWVWDRRGRIGHMPMVSPEQLQKLSLAHLVMAPMKSESEMPAAGESPAGDGGEI